MRTSWWRNAIWVSPWAIGFLAFIALPTAMSLWYGFTDYALLEPPVFIGLENYRELWGDAMLRRTVVNTLVYGAGSVGLGTVAGIALALLLHERVRGRAIARAAVFLPTLVPIIAVALGWSWMYNAESGLVNRALGVVGITGPAWLDDAGWAMTALILMSLWSVGGAVVIYIAALGDVPMSLYEAADLDGVSAAGRVRHVTLPMISPAILFNVVVSTIWALQVFAVPLVMTRGGPENATRFYTMYLYENAFLYGRMGYACALGWIQLIAVVMLTAGLFAVSRRLVHYRA